MKDFLMNQPGELWAVNFNRDDRWFQNLDWQSQFEISRYSTANLSEPCVLYSSAKHFPSKMTLLINQPDVQSWTKCLYEKWVQMGRLDLVVFLPQIFTKDRFLQEWNSQEAHIAQLHIIEDFRD